MPRPATVRAVNDVDDQPEPEPAGRVVTVDYEGHVYSFDADTVTIDALEDFENQKYIRAIRAIIGVEQWSEYKSRHPRAVDLEGFIAALLTAAGTVGNPSASSAS